jgi:hypothetical protein
MRTFFLIILLSGFAAACTKHGSGSAMVAGKAILIDSNPAQCPYLTKDVNGNVVLSWIRTINDSTTSLCYAISKDGNTFSTPVMIPNSQNIQPHSENIPRIIFKPSGEILAFWGAANPNPVNKYSGVVFYTQSFDQGKTWTLPTQLVTDTSGFDQRYYDVALLANGEVGILWLDNRTTRNKEGSSLYFASSRGKDGFKNEKLISQPCCQCCRTDLYIDKKGGIHALFRGIIQDSIRDMVHIVSEDGGKNFSEPKRINEDNWVIKGCPHTGPAMTENNEGLHFAWFTGGKNKGCYYTRSSDNGKTFMMHDSVSSRGSHPQVASFSNGQVLIVWDEPGKSPLMSTKQIGVQIRDAKGKHLNTKIISSDKGLASYPVIASGKFNSAIVAYIDKQDKTNQVKYQVLTFE